MASGGELCDTCGQHTEYHDLVAIFKLGDKREYTVPSFPVFTVTLREVLYQFVDHEDSSVYTGFIRECPALARPYPSLIKLCSGYTNSFFIERNLTVPQLMLEERICFKVKCM